MAAGNIKGITIEFEGNTTKLGKAIKDINRDMSTLDRELKQVNNALKFNPTSVTLWQQKQQILTQKIEDTQKKLDLLKKAQAEMDASGVDKNSKEYRELQRDIVTTESKLKTFKQQLKSIGSANLKALSEQFKAVGAKVKEVGESLTKNVTGPIVALGAASIASFKAVDEGLDTVVKKTGASGKELEAMQQSVKNLASEIPTDFATAGDAIGQVNTRFGLTGKELETLSGQFIKFANINNTDVTTAVDGTQKALAAFGLDASQAGTLLDQLNTTGQKTGVDMQTLLSGLVQNATAFQELGLSAEQAAVLMGQMETSGANSETVMQGLRKALKNAAKDGIPLDKALSDLQDTIAGDKDGVDGLTAAYDLFGKSGDQIYGAVKNGTLNFKDLAKTATDAGGSIDKTFENTLDPTDDFKMAMNDLKTAGSELGSTLLTVLAPIIQKVAGWIQKVTEAWNKLSPGAQKAIVIAGLVAAAIGPVLVIIGTLISSIGAIIGVIGALGPVIAVLTGPFGLIVAAIAAAIAAMVWLTKNFDKVEAGAKALWKSLVEAWNAIKAAAVKVWNSIVAAIVGVWNKIKTAVGTAINAVKTTVSNVFNAVKSTVSTIWNGIKTTISNVWNGIKSGVSTAINAVKSTVSSVFNSIKSTVSSIWNGIKTAITTPINAAKTAVKNAIDAIKKIINGAHLKLPHFKLPHFKINGGKLPWGIGGKGSPPSISVDWYAKGGIFDGASLIGVGEKGPEAVVPLDTLWNKLDRIADASSGGPSIVINVQASPGMDTAALAAEVERRLINSVNRRRLAWQ